MFGLCNRCIGSYRISKSVFIDSILSIIHSVIRSSFIRIIDVFRKISIYIYTVIFFYDSVNHSATSYKKDGADETKNSDAIDKDVTYEGETKKAGVSEEISLQNENIYNIDLGLIADKKFDLKLEKTISKITLNNNKQSKVYEYNKNLAKIDIASKDADNTTMIVEYKIKITNEGAIPGYVKKIADYIPESLKFNSELNKDWYTAKENNTIYNSSLSNTLINPGES